MNLSLRNAYLEESESISQLLSHYLDIEVKVSRDELGSWLTTVAEIEGRVVAFMGIELDQDATVSQSMFYLDQDYRDSDVAVKVIKDMKSKLREEEVRSVTLSVLEQDVALFAACGAKELTDVDFVSTIDTKPMRMVHMDLVRALPKHSVEDTLDQLFCCEENIIRTKPKVLFLYGSTREGSYSRKLANEAAKIIAGFGAETRIFAPNDIPLADTSLTQSKDESQLPKSVIELRDAVSWSDAMVWISPEIHGAMSATFKNLIDWLPLTVDAKRTSQGKVVALMQISGGSQSFNAVNQMRVLGRWMRTYTIPNQSSLPTAYKQFHEDGTLKDTSYRNRVIDVMEELFRMTLLLRNALPTLLNRWSETPQYDDDEPRPHITFQSAKRSLSK
ncbi:NAD(P)H-dependent oxidoreductase [Vibrio sp. S4M6]|uniref:NAD(P)H-dependent oxidoreductase n=1 Tax=Vibrio sinus TaxID=2946865 RepID=UPI00202A41DE|nr:NAD(P)H-dependent oxidoreductase [Vibrio sinus]MCL9782709.1 NAD(P)H-dependent oxidoreductase [Vibrio sinus]